MILVSVVVAAVAVIFLLPTLSDLVSAGVAAAAERHGDGSRPAQSPRFLILIPAHDEELLIDACLDSLSALDYPPGSVDVVVVADNCTDATADRARRAGV